MSRAYGFISIIGVFAILMLTGCGTRYIQDTKIEYTKEKAELAKIVRAYRDALRDKDIDTLEKMTSDRYYENASTTTDATDDYGRNGLQKVFADLKNTVRKVEVTLVIKDIVIMGDRARVDVEYDAKYLLALGEQDRWETRNDKNRITFRKDQEGEWRISGGL